MDLIIHVWEGFVLEPLPYLIAILLLYETKGDLDHQIQLSNITSNQITMAANEPASVISLELSLDVLIPQYGMREKKGYWKLSEAEQLSTMSHMHLCCILQPTYLAKERKRHLEHSQEHGNFSDKTSELSCCHSTAASFETGRGGKELAQIHNPSIITFCP